MYFIVGATGSLGGQVAKALLARGERVRVLVRGESPFRQKGRYTDPAELRALGAEVVTGDLRAPETITAHLPGARVVLSTASGTKRAPPDTVEAVDHHGTAALAAAAQDAAVEHLVYVSARGIGPDAPPFLRPKWEAEQALSRLGPPTTIVRPTKFMQDWIGFVLGAQLQGGTRVQLIGERDAHRTYVHEGDVARLLTAVLLDDPPGPDESPRVIDFTADAATRTELVARIAAVTGMPLTVEHLPLGQPVTTAPEPLGQTIAHLLGVDADGPDDTELTHAVAERYGLEPLSIDDFLREAFASATA